MRTITIILLSFAVAGIAQAQAPSPTPAPSPSPAPSVVPGADVPRIEFNLWREFGAGVTDGKLYDTATRREFTTHSRRILYITDISWSCSSDVEARLEWDLAVDVPIDMVKFPLTAQGSNGTGRKTPKSCYQQGITPILTTDRAANGVVFVDGYME